MNSFIDLRNTSTQGLSIDSAFANFNRFEGFNPEVISSRNETGLSFIKGEHSFYADGSNIMLSDIKQMPKAMADSALLPVMDKILKSDLKIPFTEKVIKNSPVIVGEKTGTSEKPDQRVSYRYYINRYEQLIDSYPNEPYQSDLFFHYD